MISKNICEIIQQQQMRSEDWKITEPNATFVTFIHIGIWRMSVDKQKCCKWERKQTNAHCEWETINYKLQTRMFFDELPAQELIN